VEIDPKIDTRHSLFLLIDCATNRFDRISLSTSTRGSLLLYGAPVQSITGSDVVVVFVEQIGCSFCCCFLLVLSIVSNSSRTRRRLAIDRFNQHNVGLGHLTLKVMLINELRLLLI